VAPTSRPDADVADLAAARALIATLQDQLTKTRRENAALRHQLDVLCQRLFGRKADRVDPRQLQLASEQLANEPGAVTEPIEMDSGETPVQGHVRRKQPSGRRPLPAHLPRRRVEIDVSEAEKACPCGRARVRMGEAVTEKLEYEPASFVIVETARAKYACPSCHTGVVEAAAPPQAVERSLAGEGLLAHVVVSKYVDHLPLHRLERIFAREGLDLARTTLCGWVADVAAALAPIDAHLRTTITQATYLQTDDTPITVLTDDGPGSYKGRLWVYLDPLGRQSSSTPRARTRATARSDSSPPSPACCRPMPTAAMTPCIGGAHPDGHSRDRRHRLSEAGHPVGGRAAAVLRGAGEDRQLPSGVSSALIDGRTWPLAFDLYLPTSWADDAARRATAGIPPTVRFREKWRIALAQARAVLKAGFTLTGVVVDADYGNNAAFRAGLERLGLSRYRSKLIPSTSLTLANQHVTTVLRHPDHPFTASGDSLLRRASSPVSHSGSCISIVQAQIANHR
jgi:transposase